MKPEVKQEWTRRLRSGKIPQAVERLENVDGSMCCLGVLSKMAHEAGVVDRCLTEYGFVEYDNNPSTLPPSVMEWAGLDHSNPTLSTSVVPERFQGYYDDHNHIPSLAALNDEGVSFVEIADIIDANF